MSASALRSLTASASWCALTLLWATSHACANPLPTQRPPPIAGLPYQLVKDWTFGQTVDDIDTLRAEFHTRYIYNNGQLDRLNDEWQRYRDNDNHVLDSDHLTLVARAPRGLGAGKIESGMLRSRWSGTYGYFEARLKVPPGRGFWPAFWLNPQDQIWPPEIDIVEIVNNGRDTTRHSFHFVHPGKPTCSATTHSALDRLHRYTPGADYAEAFHTFAVHWEPGRIRHYVDAQLVVDRACEWNHRDGRHAGAAHVLLNLAVGGRWPGPPKRLQDFPARLEVQFIRVWQRQAAP